MNNRRLNTAIFIFVALVYLTGQILIGTYHPDEHRFDFDSPSDVDFLYYGAIINSLFNDIPPANPAYAGVKLTQPYLQFIPAAILAKLVNPYNAIRILNLVYLVLFGILFIRFFPQRFGLAAAILFLSSSFGSQINAAGIDFIGRGFTHVPFFILIAITLYGKRSLWKGLSIFAAALINGYLMIILMVFLLVDFLSVRKKESLYYILAGVLGLLAASAIVSSETVNKPFYFLFSESFYFDPKAVLIHAVPFLIMAIFLKERRMTALLLVSIIFGSLIHYNPFFPIFMIYYSGAMLLANGEIRRPKGSIIVGIIVAVMVLGFFIEAYRKYDPGRMNYYPRDDSRLQAALEWAGNHTDDDECFMALTADADDLALLMQYRPVYLGYIGHVSHLGLPWKERYNLTMVTFQTGRAPEIVDYIFYGPVERKYFPGFNTTLKIAYRDNFVTIYRTR